MDISTGLIAKGTVGALAASAAVGGGVMAGTDWFDGLWPGSEISEDVGHSQDGEVTETVPDGVPSPAESGQVNNPSRSDTDTVTTSESGRGQDASTQDSGQTSNLSVNGGSSAPSAGGGSAQEGQGTNGGLGGDALQPKEPGADSGAATQNHQNHNPSRGVGGKKQEKNLTDWDKALINYLNEAGQDERDIVFDVKTGKETKEDLSTTFPEFEKDTNKKKLTITATVTTSNTNLRGSDHSTKITELKKLNSDKDWTWECTITISKENKTDSINLESKEKLIGPDGFFNKLMKSVSEENEEAKKKNLRELKAKFIENCAGARGKNPTTSLTDEKISVEKNFDLEGKSGETNWKIKEKDFNSWFLTTNQAQ